jgi:hypothetical protein
VAHESRERLADQLSSLLTAMHATIRETFEEDRPRHQGKRRRASAPRHAKRRGGRVLAALRRLFRA